MTKEEQDRARQECYDCKHRREIPGDCHSKCMNPSRTVFENGNAHGKKNGWFLYPLNFDPVWKESLCENFESTVNPAISQAVSDETHAQTS